MIKKLSLAIILIFSLACSTFSGFVSTPTPTATITPQPTLTPTRTITPTPAPETREVNVESGGFSIMVPVDFETNLNQGVLTIFNNDGTLIISITGTPYEGSSNNLDDVINGFVEGVASNGGKLDQSEPYPIVVNGVEGLAADLTGTLFDEPTEGKVFAVLPQADFLILGLGISNVTEDAQAWKANGSIIFQGLIDSMQFTEIQNTSEPVDNGTTSCTISTDDTYGYTQENPIEVGGDAFDGPSRERAYLDNLLGTNGESLSYEREGSLSTDITILDAYKVTGPGIDTVLYLDEYNYSDPQAPVGFTCAGSFPLSQP
jgi:hypothetical protein